MNRDALREKIAAQVRAPYTKHTYSQLSSPIRKRIDAIMAAVDEYVDYVIGEDLTEFEPGDSEWQDAVNQSKKEQRERGK